MTRILLGLSFCLAAASTFAEGPYSERSDAELTSIAAGWETLAEDQRRALLTEMRSRMETKTKDGAPPLIAIRTERRYGRLVRQPDGSVVRVETTEQVVRFQRVDDGSAAPADRAYGVGFERRATEESQSREASGAARTDPGKPVLIEHTER